jgi:hypothetical protein
VPVENRDTPVNKANRHREAGLAPNCRRLSRYDETGLIWLLKGRPVVALTEATAAIENPTGAITIYRKNNKPALGPVGDSLDDLER